ncbi:MAG: hypothetical protein U0T32_01220 [Chitinophagales bacterium]
MALRKRTACKKRFNVFRVTRDKEYDLAQGTAGSKVLYFTANQNAETEIVKVQLQSRILLARIKEFEFDFAALDIKDVSRWEIFSPNSWYAKTELKEKGSSSIGGLKLWFDKKFGRLASEEKELWLRETNN